MIKTKDFNQAAFLVANDIKLLNYTTDELGQMWFEFPDDVTTRDLEHSFNLATAMVNVQKFGAASKMLKALIYQNRRNIYEHKLGKLDYNTAR
jgi:hypothetical protein